MEKQSQIVWMPIDEVHPYERNPRINDGAVDAVANSIREFGFRNPILVDGEHVIIAGHTRLKAAIALGMDRVPVVVIDDLPEEKVRALRLADNKTAELAEWDFELLDVELDGIQDIDMSEFGFDAEVDFSNLESMMGDVDQEYSDFVDKFKPKHTTDDCFTPPEVYDAVSKWVFEQYGNKWTKIVRPFYPGGDYRTVQYPKGCLVLDNPPFSIQAEILDFYNANHINYFLFANGLTTFSVMKSRPATNCIITGQGIRYENGAEINTSYLTSLGGHRIRLSPSLRDAIQDAQRGEEPMARYDYPPCIKSAATFGKDVAAGVHLDIEPEEVEFISGLEATPNGIYGGGAMIADTAVKRLDDARQAAVRRDCQRESQAMIISLSQSEKERLADLNRRASAVSRA